MVAGTVSNCLSSLLGMEPRRGMYRAPWLETKMPAQPTSQAWTASSGVNTPLTTKGNLVMLFNQATSCHVKLVSKSSVA